MPAPPPLPAPQPPPAPSPEPPPAPYPEPPRAAPEDLILKKDESLSLDTSTIIPGLNMNNANLSISHATITITGDLNADNSSIAVGGLLIVEKNLNLNGGIIHFNAGNAVIEVNGAIHMNNTLLYIDLNHANPNTDRFLLINSSNSNNTLNYHLIIKNAPPCLETKKVNSTKTVSVVFLSSSNFECSDYFVPTLALVCGSLIVCFCVTGVYYYASRFSRAYHLQTLEVPNTSVSF
uniref:Uncharacterized protein n=1 Tax=Arcella intermedia TaxID=1963864 RepID=A0A6B2LFX9_9EUKA